MRVEYMLYAKDHCGKTWLKNQFTAIYPYYSTVTVCSGTGSTPPNVGEGTPIILPRGVDKEPKSGGRSKDFTEIVPGEDRAPSEGTLPGLPSRAPTTSKPVVTLVIYDDNPRTRAELQQANADGSLAGRYSVGAVVIPNSRAEFDALARSHPSAIVRETIPEQGIYRTVGDLHGSPVDADFRYTTTVVDATASRPQGKSGQASANYSGGGSQQTSSSGTYSAEKKVKSSPIIDTPIKVKPTIPTTGDTGIA